jgi:hypothetical protein
MSDLFDKVTADQDIFKKIFSKIPGFNGYIERQNRRASDKLLREYISGHFEHLWQRISELQKDLINQGNIEYIDDLESSAIKLRQFIDRVRTASYGYSGFFDAIKINEEELAQVYKYDYTLLQLEETVSRAIDNVEQSLGSDGLPAAIRNLTSTTRQCVEAFDKRTEVMLGTSDTPAAQ